MTLVLFTGMVGPREGDLAAACANRPEVVLGRRCADLAEVLAVGSAGLGEVAVLTPDLPGLDRPAVAQLLACGVWVVILHAGPATASQPLWLSWGVTAVVSAQGQPGSWITQIGQAVEAARTAPGAGPVPPSVAAGEQAPGELMAVWGPMGAPGRTSVAVALASELSALGHLVLLADADTYAASVAASLGLIDESAGLLAAARISATGVIAPAAVRALAVEVLPGLGVLTGLPGPARWDELQPGALGEVWRACRQAARWTIADVGFSLDSGAVGGLGEGPGASGSQRNAAALSVLGQATAVIAVGLPGPVGLARLVRGLQDLRALCPQVPVRIVLNQNRPTVMPQQREVTAVIERFAGQYPVTWVPWDAAAFDRCAANGRSLIEVAPASPARLALLALAMDLTSQGDRT